MAMELGEEEDQFDPVDQDELDAAIAANEMDDALARGEGGDDDDWDEEDLHGSRPIDDPEDADQADALDDGEDGAT